MDAKNLISSRELILERMIQYFIKHSGIIALYLSGSLAEDEHDEFSDIDFRVVVEENYIQKYIDMKLEAPMNWGELLFNEVTPGGWGRNVCVSHFLPFIKADVFYYKPSDLVPNPWHNRGVKILFDPSGIVSEMLDKSKLLEFEYNSEHVDLLIMKAIACAHEVYRKAHRGEYIYAQDALHLLRSRIIEADDILNKRAIENFAHFERRGTKKIVDKILLSYQEANKIKLLEGLMSLIPVLKDIINELHRRYKLERILSKDLMSIDLVFD